MRTTGHTRRGARAKRGATALQYGLIAPALFLFLLGIVDMGRLMWTYAGLNRGVAAAARCGAVDANNCGTEAAIKSAAAAGVWGVTIPTSTFSVDMAASCGVQVTASYSFGFFTPGLSAVTLTPSACFTKLY